MTLEETLLAHREKLLNFIRRRVPDPDIAEDVLQDGLLRALQAGGELRDGERLLPWFYRILNNAIVDTYRRRGTEAKYLEAYAENETLLGGESGRPEDEAELCECFRSLLPSLKPEYGELIEKLELSGGDTDQAAQALAERLNISRGNLKVRRHRARQALRQRLEETCRTCAVHGCLDCTCRLGT